MLRFFLRPLSAFYRMISRKRRPSWKTWIPEISLLAFSLILGVLLYRVTFVTSDVSYLLGEESVRSVSLPLSFESREEPLSLIVTLHVHVDRWIRPVLYTVRADDCLGVLQVNGIVVDQSIFAPCDIDATKDLSLGHLFHPGDNTLTVTIPDTGGRQGLWFTPSRSDALVASLRILLFLTLVFLGLLFVFRSEFQARRWTLLLLLVGTIVRLLYFDGTPFNVRSHDADGHLDYVRYVSEHWNVPLIHENWESYQPPLYYFLAAVPYSALRWIGLPDAALIQTIQLFGVLCSIGLLLAAAWMAELLFLRHQRFERLLFLGFFAVFPGLIFASARINNDALVQLLTVLSLALTVRFWQTGGNRVWYVLMVTIAAGILTKMNAVPLLPVACAALLFHPSIHWKRKLALAFAGTLVVLALTEWLFTLRAMESTGTGMVGNVGNLPKDLLVENGLDVFFTFNPWEVLVHPYNDSWSDGMRRQFFWEYFFRSAFVGEYGFGSFLQPFVQAVLASGFVGGLLAFIGLCMPGRDAWKRGFPLWIAFASIIAAHAFFRFQYPYAPSQDFRYSVGVLVPVLFFLCTVPGTLSSKWKNFAYGIIVGAAAILAVYMAVFLAVQPS